MSLGKGGSASPVTLDQLIALNDEIAALVRAGVPLERGLTEVGRDMAGQVGRLAIQIGQRLSAGQTLPAIIASEANRFPPVWRAVVEAGLRSGQLAAALQGLSITSRRVAELRRVIGTAWIYPLCVLGLAYSLFVFVTVWLAPRMLEACRSLGAPPDPISITLAWLGQTASWWAIAIPIAVTIGFALWWQRTARATTWEAAAGGREGGPPKGRWMSIRKTLATGRLATFAELLGLLMEQNVPLDEALVLAADASGDRGLGHAARAAAERIRSGERLDETHALAAPFPPFLGWLVANGARQPGISGSLFQAAESYRQQAVRAATWTATYLPILLSVVLGGTATLLQGLAVFVPIIHLLYQLR